MKDTKIDREELLQELNSLRRRVAELETRTAFPMSLETALQKERDKAQKYLDIATVIIVALNTDGIVTLINKKGCDILGYNEREIIGKNWFENFIPCKHKEEVKFIFQSLLKGKVSWVECFEHPILTKYGQKRNISWHHSILLDDEKNPIGILSSGADITETKLAKEALIRSEENYRSLTANIPVGIFRSTSDSKGRLLSANSALARMFGYRSAGEMAKIKISDLYLQPQDRQGFIERITSQKTVSEYEVQFKRKNGTVFWGSLFARAITDNKGKVIYFDGIVEDITERKKYLQELNEYSQTLEKLLKERSEFISLASHELRTPITVINGYLEIIKMNGDSFSKEKTATIINKIRDHSHRITRLVENLLDLSKLDDSKFSLDVQNCHMEPIVERVLLFCEQEALQKGINCIFSGCKGEKSPQVKGDPLAIESVLINILNNAIRYSNEDNRVILGCQKDGAFLRINCIDNGIGLPPDAEERIFDEFYRVQQGGELKGHGTGLGLSIAKKLVERMGGRIWAHSDGLGKGTTVSFTLPLVQKNSKTNEVVELKFHKN